MLRTTYNSKITNLGISSNQPQPCKRPPPLRALQARVCVTILRECSAISEETAHMIIALLTLVTLSYTSHYVRPGGRLYSTQWVGCSGIKIQNKKLQAIELQPANDRCIDSAQTMCDNLCAVTFFGQPHVCSKELGIIHDIFTLQAYIEMGEQVGEQLDSNYRIHSNIIVHQVVEYESI